MSPWTVWVDAYSVGWFDSHEYHEWRWSGQAMPLKKKTCIFFLTIPLYLRTSRIFLNKSLWCSSIDAIWLISKSAALVSLASAKENNDGQVTVGVHFSPEEFLKEAIRLCHPTEQNCLFPKEVKTNVSHLLSDESKTQWEMITKAPFEGRRLCFGQLVYFRKKSATRRTLEPNMSPGLFLGWRIDPGGWD